MTDEERYVYAVQDKNRIDLITENAKEWDTFKQRKADFIAKYGVDTGTRLLAKEEAALVDKQNKSHHVLEERELRQWDNFHAGKPLDEPEQKPEMKKDADALAKKQLEKSVVTGKQDDKQSDDLAEKRRLMLEARKQNQEDMKARHKGKTL